MTEDNQDGNPSGPFEGIEDTPDNPFADVKPPEVTEDSADTDEDQWDEMDAGEVSATLNRYQAEVEENDHNSLKLALRMGEGLLYAKDRWGQHTQWGDWLTANFKASHRTANYYMTLAENSQHVANLGDGASIRSALASIAEAKKQAKGGSSGGNSPRGGTSPQGRGANDTGTSDNNDDDEDVPDSGYVDSTVEEKVEGLYNTSAAPEFSDTEKVKLAEDLKLLIASNLEVTDPKVLHKAKIDALRNKAGKIVPMTVAEVMAEMTGPSDHSAGVIGDVIAKHWGSLEKFVAQYNSYLKERSEQATRVNKAIAGEGE